MSLNLLLNCPLWSPSSPYPRNRNPPPSSISCFVTRSRSRVHFQSVFRDGEFPCDQTRNDPILKDALKEPVAFVGGMFAGLLRLDLNEDPLREWVARTAEAAGIAVEEAETAISEDDSPQQIEIE